MDLDRKGKKISMENCMVTIVEDRLWKIRKGVG